MKLEEVAVLGVGMTRFGEYPGRTASDLAREAGVAALCATPGSPFGRSARPSRATSA